MWSCFLLDRFSSSGTDRPTFVGPEYIRAQLPIKEKLYNMEITGPTEDLQGNVPNPVDPETGQVAVATDNMGVAAYTIRLVGIWGELITYMNLGGKQRDQRPMWDDDSTFQRIKKATEKWRDTFGFVVVVEQMDANGVCACRTTADCDTRRVTAEG